MIGEVRKKVRKSLLYSSNTSDYEKQGAEAYYLHLQTSNEALSLPFRGTPVRKSPESHESPYLYDKRVGVKVKKLLSFQGNHSPNM